MQRQRRDMGTQGVKQLIYNVLISAVQLHDSITHILHSFLHFFPLWFILGGWIQFPVLSSRTLLFIHSKCDSFHLPALHPQSIPHLLLPAWQPQVCSPCL